VGRIAVSPVAGLSVRTRCGKGRKGKGKGEGFDGHHGGFVTGLSLWW
jgi:hypothetical protein